MSKNAGYLEIIKQAQLGSRDSMSRLTDDAREKIFVYIYRVTLDYHLAQDLSQDTVLEMVKSLKRLKIESDNLFWAWLYRVALGKIQHHFRYQGNKRIEQKVVNDASELLNLAAEERQSALNQLLQKENSQLVLKAMRQIDTTYRNILALRCFDQLSYSEIAMVTGGTELRARLQFFRAKQSLKKQLIQNGFNKEQLTSALVLFGAITASSGKSASAGAAAISPAALKVGITTAIAGTATSKLGIIATIAAVVAASTTIGIVKVVKNEAASVPSTYNKYESLPELPGPGLTPQVFAPGFISLDNRFEYGICLSSSGQECYFVTGAPRWASLQIMQTRYENGAWTSPVRASFSKSYSMTPSLADGDTSMYFSQDKSIYKSVRTITGWSPPIQQPGPVSLFEEHSCKVSDLGNIWVCSGRVGGKGRCDIWRLEKRGRNFIPANIQAINSAHYDCNPAPGPHEEYVVFTSERPGGFGGTDLYISFADGRRGWTAPRNLGPGINTSADEDSPYISPDNKNLFFVRQSQIDSDIYWVDVSALFPAAK
jgi:RNA polymerase sigma factor (sigma-70 family)